MVRPSGGGGTHAPVRQSHVSSPLHGLGEHRSTHLARPGAPLTLTLAQTRLGGHNTPSQSSTHEPALQWLAAGHGTPTHAGSTHRGTCADRSHACSAGQLWPGAQAHEGVQRPSLQTAPSGHVTSSQGSTQPKPRQICPAGQRTFALQLGTQALVSSQVWPSGQPKMEQSLGTQTHGPSSWGVGTDPLAQAKSASGTHCGTQAPTAQLFFLGQASGAKPLQL